MISDLHFHSRFSDGTLWPEEIVKSAKQKGLLQISLTDHDSMEGVERFMNACKAEDIIGIPGVEIDCEQPEIGFNKEILGYFPMGNYTNTRKALNQQIELRVLIAKEAISTAYKDFSMNELCWEDFIEFRAGGPEFSGLLLSITKVDIYRYLKSRNIDLPSYPIFKKEYFTRSEFKQIDQDKMKAFDVIRMIRKDNGFPVLPHPGYMFERNIDMLNKNRDSFIDKLNQMQSHGLWGIELHTYENQEVREKINREIKIIAKELKLGITYGSDSHGPGSEKDLMGDFSGVFSGFSELI